MTKKVLGGVLGAVILLAAYPSSSHAADGAICFSTVFTDVNTTTSTTSTYAQLTNSTKFSCTSSVTYTLSQLLKLGWTAESLLPVALSTTTTVNGANVTVTSKSRWQLVIRRP